MRVLVADDHELLRRGLETILREAFAEVEIRETSTAAAAGEAAQQGGWDVILLDINLPGRSGLELLPDLRRWCPQTPVVVLSAFPEDQYALRAFQLGAAAYVTKAGAASELLVAVRKALAGGRYVTPTMAERLAAALAGEAPSEPHHLLSSRELQVLRLIANGRTLKEIAAALMLSERTIGTYRTRIARKMGLGTNVELTRYAVRYGLVD